MPYFWEMRRSIDLMQAVGTVVSVTSQVIAFSALPGSIATGRLVEIDSSATNDGVYTVTNIAGNNVTVAEPINNSGASGRGSCTGPGQERVVGSGISSFPDDHTIVVSGAEFITNGVLKGDRVGVYGDAVNDGSYFVDRVQTEDSLSIVSYDTLLASGALTVSGTSAGSVRVSEGFGTLSVSGEATASWAGVEGTFPYLVDGERPCGLTSVLKVRHIPAVRTIRPITVSGEASRSWVSQNEVVLPIRSSAIAITWNYSEALGGRYNLVLGSPGTDPNYGSEDGAYWFQGSFGGQAINTNYAISCYASVLHGQTGIWYAGQDTVIRNSIVAVDGGMFLEEGSVVENLTYTDAGFGFSAVGNIQSSDASVIKTNGPSVVGVTNVIEDFRITDDTNTPVWWVFVPGPTLTARNPKEDYSATELFNLFGLASGVVDYTWAPRFVSRNQQGLAGDPISGLSVRVFEVEGASETEISGSPFTTNVSGQIDTDIYLKARYKYGFNSPVEISQRILAQGEGFRTLNQVIKMARPFEGDVAIDFLLTDFEGEVST